MQWPILHVEWDQVYPIVSVMAVAAHSVPSNGISLSVRLERALPRQVDPGAVLLFNHTEADLYSMWTVDALPGSPATLGTLSTQRYRAHMDCDGCRRVAVDGGGVVDGGGRAWWGAGAGSSPTLLVGRCPATV
jgi:hypothetical protein